MTRPKRALSVLLVSYGAAQLANIVTFITVPWLALELTGSAARTGLTAATGVLPLVIGGLFGGAIVDRIGFRQACIGADLTSGLTIGLIPLLHLTIGLEFWHLLVLVFFGALLDTPGRISREAMFPDLANRAQVSLERVNAIAETTARVSLLLGPPAAGVLIAAMGSAPVLWITTAAFLASALLIGTTARLWPASRMASNQHGPRHYFPELIEGLRYIRGARLILWLSLTLTVTMFLESHLTVILPVYANQILESPIALGLMFAGLGLGSLIGALGYALLGPRIPRRLLLVGGFAMIATVFMLLALSPPLAVIVGMLAIMGIAAGPLNALVGVLLQEQTPSNLRGRVFGLVDAVPFLAMALGRLLAGYLLEWFAVGTVLTMVGIGYIFTVIAIMINPYLRDLSPPSSCDHAGR